MFTDVTWKIVYHPADGNPMQKLVALVEASTRTFALKAFRESYGRQFIESCEKVNVQLYKSCITKGLYINDFCSLMYSP